MIVFKFKTMMSSDYRIEFQILNRAQNKQTHMVGFYELCPISLLTVSGMS